MDPIILAIVLLNICFGISIVFFERKTPEIALAWLTVLVFIPLLGFLLYLAFGQNFYRARLFRIKAEDDKKVQELVTEQLSEVARLETRSTDERESKFLRVIRMLLVSNRAIVSNNNTIEIYTNGQDKFRALFAAIDQAKDFVHVEYYYISPDGLGTEMVTHLTKKAKEGVEVRVLVDGLPFSVVPPSFWKPFIDAGGKKAVFFPGFFRFINFRFNNRNHRKIVVIDGKTAFCGGFNVGDEYVGKKELGCWRDTHVRINGDAAHLLELRFLLDWNYASKDRVEMLPRYFPKTGGTGSAAVQIVSSGPDHQHNQIKLAYLHLINTATESVYIQTPYFVPDSSLIDSLRLAAQSGIDVKIMIPCKPDHMFVYAVNHAFIADLLDAGVKAYTYDDGFIHAKTLVIDGLVASVGSANWDVRSFKLNFETNALIYNPAYAKKLREIFEDDLKHSTEITPESLKKRPLMEKVWEPVARLFSPVL
ncbi:cardiolipin synthase [uncultured Methanoregula sp.]|uniref:cardiolipin synthase n=1 Tax=uncultured Methanoregula sp. TaxID=1005933 RepID=UPI002AABC20B|nr:cardiolipin synthase [uncultured Methanoregula sp.]